MSKKLLIASIVLSLPVSAYGSDPFENDCISNSFYSLVSGFIFNADLEENCKITRQRSLVTSIDFKYSASMTPDSVYRAAISELTNVRLRPDFTSDSIHRSDSKTSSKGATFHAKAPEGFFILE